MNILMKANTYLIRRLTGILLISFLVAASWSCFGYRPALTPEDPHWSDDDRREITKPTKHDPSLAWQTAQRITFEQAQQLLDLDRSFRKLGGNPKESWNINSFDEVPNSSWFTNRHYFSQLSPEQLALGALFAGGPDKSGPWTVFRPKIGGQTAGFWIRDAKGNQYILKFDPPDNPEMATAAAAITGRFFYACGYNVPQETISSFKPEDLIIQEGLTYKNEFDQRLPFDRAKLNEILSKAYRNADGSYRCLASQALPNILGPFDFDGRRRDDSNDWCDHEHRRELRALYVFCSLVNHWDIKDQNSMDIFVGDDDKGYVEHYLLDFGSALGSGGYGPQEATAGYANLFDLRDALVSLFTLGLKKWQWEDAKPYEYPSIGYFESDIFQPAKWDPVYPIPAFENMTRRDAFWAAKIIMSLTDDDLGALVDAGQFSNPGARNYLFKTLRIRRDKIGSHWFSKVNPLDRFVIDQSETNLTITFDDLETLHGFDLGKRYYQYEWLYHDDMVVAEQTVSKTEITVSADESHALRAAYKNDQSTTSNLFELRIRTGRSNGKLSRPVVLWFWYHTDRGRFQLVGVEH